MLLLQFVVSGIATGCFLILATIGFSLTRRVEGFLNIAHAELLGVGAFATWWLNTRFGLHVVAAGAVAVALTALIGLGTARVIYDPIRKRGPAVLLITSTGVAFVIGGVIDGLIGTGIRTLQIDLAERYEVSGIRITSHQIILVVLAAAVSVSLALFLNRTRTGLAIRAMAANPALAGSRGIDLRGTSRATWLISSGLAGLAGVMLAVIATLTTDLPFAQILQILAVAIVAGLGSLYAVIVAGLLVGIAMDMSAFWIPAGYRPLVAFAAVIVVLLFRPAGIAGVRAA